MSFLRCSREAFERFDMNMAVLGLNHFERLQKSLFSENSLFDDDDDDDDCGLRSNPRLPKEGDDAPPSPRRPPTRGKNALLSNLSAKGGGDCRECHRWKRLSRMHMDMLHSLVAELEEGILLEASLSVSRDLIRDLVRTDEYHRLEHRRVGGLNLSVGEDGDGQIGRSLFGEINPSPAQVGWELLGGLPMLWSCDVISS